MLAESPPVLAPLVNHVEKHLLALGYQDGDRVSLRAFHSTDKSIPGQNWHFTFPELPVSKMEEWHRHDFGVYVVVNPGGNKDADITHGLAVFYEHDDLEKDLSKDLWQSLGLPKPSLQVDTGGKSIHSYWAFNRLLEVEEWRALQIDLMEFADSDRSLKNPSRVMRLAGCVHPKTGQYSKIVGGNGQPVDYDEFRALVPVHRPEQSEIPLGSASLKQNWTEFDRGFSMPCDYSIPLDVCLSLDSRDLLANGASSERNTNGAKLARDIIGTAQYLQSIGQRFEGDPKSLFLGYCSRCPGGEGWVSAEWESVWKSANQKRPGPSLPPEKIEGCAKAWVWRNEICTAPSAPQSGNSEQVVSSSQPQSTTLDPETEGETREQKAERLTVLLREYSETSNPVVQELLAIDIRKDFGISPRALERLVDKIQPKKEPELRHVADVSIGLFDEVEQRSLGMILPGISCGFYDLDAMTQGFQRSDLIIVAGRPSMGKTGITLQMVRNIAYTHKLPCLVFNLEMSNRQMLTRLWSAESNIEGQRIKSGKIAQHEWEPLGLANASIASLPIYISDAVSVTVQDIAKLSTEFAQEHGAIGCIMIDYLQLMEGMGDNRVQAIAQITRKLKMLARALDVPILVLSQLSRGVENRTNKRPMMSDLRESGGIENDADLIMMLYREEYYDPDTPDLGITEIIINKHRNGPTGTIKVLFEPQFVRFRNLQSNASIG